MKHCATFLGLLAFLTGLGSCNLSSPRGHRPLMAGIQPSPAAAEAAAQVSPAVETDFDSLLPRVQKAGTPSQVLRREGYVVSYNKDNRIANWVMWHLTADRTSGPFKRDGAKFLTDRRAQEESFLLTNICPQNHQLNAGDWNEMELQCRRWARRYGDIYVVAGPVLLNKRHKTVGRAQVVVPEAFYKVVLCLRGKPKAIGFIYRNEPGNRPKGDYVNSVDEVERITRIDFFPGLPDKMEHMVESRQDLSEW